ncbi:MAG: hypothetical protein H7317_08565 [Pseudorhodobacter sp.]|nr:hypothetical protein [Pseudorhodobacter sp.]
MALRPADPFDKPTVDPRYLSDPADLELTVDAVLACREIGLAPGFQAIGVRVFWPGGSGCQHHDWREGGGDGSGLASPGGFAPPGTNAAALVPPAEYLAKGKGTNFE